VTEASNDHTRLAALFLDPPQRGATRSVRQPVTLPDMLDTPGGVPKTFSSS